MMVEYDTGDWNKKLDLCDAMSLHSAGYEGWDLDGDMPHTVRVDLIWGDGTNLQKEILNWADDNCNGYFYQYSIGTEGGTVTIRSGDKFSITLAFQKKEDAFMFKMRWV